MKKWIKILCLVLFLLLPLSSQSVQAVGAEKVEVQISEANKQKLTEQISPNTSSNLFETLIVSTNEEIRKLELVQDYVKYLFTSIQTFWVPDPSLLGSLNFIYGAIQMMTMVFNLLSFLPSFIVLILVNASDTNFINAILSPLQTLTNQIFNWGDAEGLGVTVLTLLILISILQNIIYKGSIATQLGISRGSFRSLLQTVFGGIVTGFLIVGIATNGIPVVRKLEAQLVESITTQFTLGEAGLPTIVAQKKMVFDIFNRIPFEMRHFGNAVTINVKNEIEKITQKINEVESNFVAEKTNREAQGDSLEDIVQLEADKNAEIALLQKKLDNYKAHGDANEIPIEERKRNFLANASSDEAKKDYETYDNTSMPNVNNSVQILFLSFIQVFQNTGSSIMVGVPYTIFIVIKFARELSLMFSAYFLTMGVIKKNKIVLHWALNQFSWMIVMSFLNLGFEIGLYYITILLNLFVSSGMGGILLFSLLSFMFGIIIYKNKHVLWKWIKSFTSNMMDSYRDPGINPFSQIKEATVDSLNINGNKGNAEFNAKGDTIGNEKNDGIFTKPSNTKKAVSNDSLGEKMETSIPGNNSGLHESNQENYDIGYEGVADIDEVLESPKSESLDVQRVRKSLDSSPITEQQRAALAGQDFVRYKDRAKHRVMDRPNVYEPRNELEAAQVISYMYGITDNEPNVPRKKRVSNEAIVEPTVEIQTFKGESNININNEDNLYLMMLENEKK